MWPYTHQEFPDIKVAVLLLIASPNASESIYLEDSGIRDEDRMRLSVVLPFSVQSCGHPAFEGIPLRNRHLQ